MMAPLPPTAGLNYMVGQCCNSPTSRRMVMPRVIRTGMVMRLVMETDLLSAMETSLDSGLCDVGGWRRHRFLCLGMFGLS